MPLGNRCEMPTRLSNPSARYTARRACSMLVEASAGNPITSPAAKMWGTQVRKWSSTGITPCSPTVTPATGRFSFSVLLFRPAATSTASTISVDPEDIQPDAGFAPPAAIHYVLVQMEHHTVARHGSGQRARHFRVQEWQEHITAIDQIHMRPQDRSEE